jgi:molybdate transport system substrate-binding protein
MAMGPTRAFVWLSLVGLVLPVSGHGAETRVAVAANFAAPMQALASAFAHDTGHRAQVVTGATGRLYAQIVNGAPFDVLLAADDRTPRKLVSDKLAVGDSEFTYALGTLVLWSANPSFVDAGGAVLRRGQFAHLAIANPRVAPYGVAATQALEALGLLTALRPKIVEGEDVGQTATFVATGNAELGFVAFSQVSGPGHLPAGSHWIVPAKLYAPIRQDAVLLSRGSSNPAARALCDYLRGQSAKALIRAYGYGLDDVGATDPPAAEGGLPPSPP